MTAPSHDELPPPSPTPVIAPTLELRLSGVTGEPWSATAILSFNKSESPSFALGECLTAEDAADVRWYIEEYDRLPEAGHRVRAAATETLLRRHGQALWRLLHPPEAQAWLSAVRQAGTGRLIIRAEQPTDEIVFRTPWELLRPGDGDGAWLHELGVAVVRLLPPRPATPGLNVLVVVSRPDDQGFLEPRALAQALLDAVHDRPEVSVVFSRPPTFDALLNALQGGKNLGQPYDVVVFDGHGSTGPDGQGLLCFENDEGKTQELYADALGQWLGGYGVRVVVLAACRSADRSGAGETVAASLVRHGVGSVVAVAYTMHVDLERPTLAGFFDGLARGWSVSMALEEGRRRAFANPQRRLRIAPDAVTVPLQDWFIPQLYQGGEDPVLLPPQTSEGAARQQPWEPAGFPPPPWAGFQGRGWHLHHLERVILKKPIVILHGPAGIGKTALAREAAHWWVRTRLFASGALFVSFETRPSPAAIVARLGELLEGIEFHKHKDPVARLTEIFTQWSILIVWDNFESVLPAFRQGQPTPPELAQYAAQWTQGGSRLLITCRDAQVGFDACPYALNELYIDGAKELLFHCLERVGANHDERVRLGLTVDAVADLVERLGRHPLAIELIAPFLPRLGLAAVLADLGSLLATAEQQHEEGRNRSLMASLAFSLQHLSEPARQALSGIALLSGGWFASLTAGALGLSAEAWEPIRTELERTGMVRIEGELLWPHPILAELPDLQPSPEQEKSFIESARNVCQWVMGLLAGNDEKGAVSTFAFCEKAVRRALDRSLAKGGSDAWELSRGLQAYLIFQGRFNEASALLNRVQQQPIGAEEELSATASNQERETAFALLITDSATGKARLEALLARLQTVQSRDTRSERAWTQVRLARAHVNFGNYQGALELLDQALPLMEELEAENKVRPGSRTIILGERAYVLLSLERFAEGKALMEQALAQLREAKSNTLLAGLSFQFAERLSERGYFAQAEEHCREALQAARDAGLQPVIGVTLYQLGVLTMRAGKLDEAAHLLQEAVEAYQDLLEGVPVMMVFIALGELDHRRGDLEAALAWYDRVLQMAEQHSAPDVRALTRSKRATTYYQQSRQSSEPTEARRLLDLAIAEDREALPVLEGYGGLRQAQMQANVNLAIRLREVSALEEAQVHAQKALELATIPSEAAPDLWKALEILETLARDRGDEGTAVFLRQRKEMARIEAEAKARRSSVRADPAPTDNRAGEVKKVETIHNQGEKVGRNDPCPCGSGKKYKNCCLREKAV